jgi:hypothetical protein
VIDVDESEQSSSGQALAWARKIPGDCKCAATRNLTLSFVCRGCWVFLDIEEQEVAAGAAAPAKVELKNRQRNSQE